MRYFSDFARVDDHEELLASTYVAIYRNRELWVQIVFPFRFHRLLRDLKIVKQKFTIRIFNFTF